MTRWIQTIGTVIFAVIFSQVTAQENGDIRGLVQPRDQALISSEISARVIDLPFRAGDAFNKGDLILEFDCAMYQAQLEAASANLEAKKSEYANAQELLSYKATSPIQVEILKSETRQAEAQFEIERLRVEGCQIKAPYSGRVIELLVNEHESVNSGTKLIAILSDEQLEIELIVPSSWPNWLNKGDAFSIRIDETGKRYEAQILRIGAAVDPVSQTILVVGTFRESLIDVRAGMSGTAQFSNQGSNQP